MKILFATLLITGFLTNSAYAELSGTNDKRETAAVTEYNQKYIDEVNTERQLENAQKEERAKFHEKLDNKIKH